ELAGFVRRPPDLELTVDLSGVNPLRRETLVGRLVMPAAALVDRGFNNQLRLESRPTPLSANLRSTKGRGVVLDLGTSVLDLRIGTPLFSRSAPPFVRDNYKREFALADRDNNGYLDQNEASSRPLFQALFKLMDLDGDGKLYEKEMLAYLDQMQNLREK